VSVEFTPHTDKQEQAIYSTKKILALATGIQYGKTTVGSLRMKRAMFQHCDPTDNFIICAPTYKIMAQSTLPSFLTTMQGCGTFSKVDAVFKMKGGGTCYFRTGTEPDSIVGITNVRHVWGDEAGKYSLYFWENMQGRAAFMNCPITLTTSPYSLNWFYKEIIREVKRGKRDADVELIQAASTENPYFPIAEYERRKKLMDPRRFNMMFGGQFDRMEGLVYDCWSDEENYIDMFQLPMGTRYFGAIDWGYTHPFVLKIRAITPSGQHFGVSEFHQTQLTITDIVKICKQKHQIFDLQAVYCDPSQPSNIAELCANGIPAIGAINNIRKGIDVHYELIKSRMYKEFRGRNPYSADERDSYHYPEEQDVKPDQDIKEKLPVDQDNHCMDVDRYLSVMTHKTHEKRIPTVPNEAKKKNPSHSIGVPTARRSRITHHSEDFG